MKKWLLITLAVFLASTSLQAQESVPAVCPQISIVGPAGDIHRGDLVRFAIGLEGLENPGKFTYEWTVSAGTISEGQGNPWISVITDQSLDSDELIANVTAIGLPKECPKTASFAARVHRRVGSPIVLDRFTSTTARGIRTRLDGVVKELAAFPRLDLIFIVNTRKGDPPSTFARREALIRNYLTATHKISPTRMHFAHGGELPRSYTSIYLIPRSDALKMFATRANSQTECPTITVTAPAGIVPPGETATFLAELRGAIPEKATYFWTINDSYIVGGQGTLELKARYKRTAWGRGVTATLNVAGLPDGCPRSASATLPVIIDPGPERIGVVKNPAYVIDRRLLAKIGRTLRERADSQLYVIVYARSPNRRLQNSILKQLSTTKIDPSRFTIVTESAGKDHEVGIWLVPLGAGNPMP